MVTVFHILYYTGSLIEPVTKTLPPNFWKSMMAYISPLDLIHLFFVWNSVNWDYKKKIPGFFQLFQPTANCFIFSIWGPENETIGIGDNILLQILSYIFCYSLPEWQYIWDRQIPASVFGSVVYRLKCGGIRSHRLPRVRKIVRLDPTFRESLSSVKVARLYDISYITFLTLWLNFRETSSPPPPPAPTRTRAGRSPCVPRYSRAPFPGRLSRGLKYPWDKRQSICYVTYNV